ncbi:MAG: anti-sigma factor family protein [Actinomycetota bacterium]
MRHLGDRTSAYADGRLTGRRLARAEAHLRVCSSCARQVEAERALAERLRCLGPARSPSGLPERIIASAPAGTGPWRRAVHWATDRASLRGWRRRFTVRLGVGSGLIAAGVAGIVLLGSVPDDPASLRAAAAGGAALRGPVQTVAMVQDSTEATTRTLRDHGWALPADLPADLHITGATIHTEGDTQMLEVEIVGGSGVATVFQGRGSLDATLLPEHAEFVQCGDLSTVVVGDSEVRFRVAALLPAAAVDSSLAGRFDRGVQAILTFLREVAP